MARHQRKASSESQVNPATDSTLEAEQLALAQFLIPSRRDRFRTLLRTDRGRRMLRERLAHFDDLDPRACIPVPSAQQSVAEIEKFLRAHGAPPSCVVISENSALDGRRIALHDALAETVGRGSGTLISCVAHRLGYYEGEDPGRRFLLHVAAG